MGGPLLWELREFCRAKLAVWWHRLWEVRWRRLRLRHAFAALLGSTGGQTYTALVRCA
jgi:hypothetical protein